MANSPPRDIPLAKAIPLEQKFFYSIEYPGFVAPQSISKAIDRLGGPQIVTDTFRRALKVDLKLKDNDPYAHPPNGQVVATQNLVMKVVRRKRKVQRPKVDNSSETEPHGQFTVQVLGLAQKTLRFRSECH
jgi:general transcription factor 3C polypeptide 5 (transcription factor C subunit 1)